MVLFDADIGKARCFEQALRRTFGDREAAQPGVVVGAAAAMGTASSDQQGRGQDVGGGSCNGIDGGRASWAGRAEAGGDGAGSRGCAEVLWETLAAAPGRAQVRTERAPTCVIPTR